VILKNVHGWVRITQGARTVVAQAISPGTFVSGTAIELPVAAPREQPVAGTVYRVRAELVYEGGVASLDTDVTFGRHAAQVQSRYTPHARAHGDLARWLAIALGAAALLAMLGALLRRRRRALLRRSAVLARVRSELARCRELELPLSLIRVDLAGEVSAARLRGTAKAMRTVLRRADSVGYLGEGQLLVLLPGARAALAHALAEELEARLAAAGGGGPFAGVRCWTPAPDADAEDVVAQATLAEHDERVAEKVGASSA